MRLWSVLLVLMLCGPVGAGEHWRLWKSAKLADVVVEDRLYVGFFVHIAIRNRSTRSLGVDLGRPGRLVYPNQWGGGDQPRRVGVDERRLPWRGISESEAIQLRKDFGAGHLITVAPGGEADYFVAFNGSAGQSEVDKLAAKFLVVALDGQVRVCDGQTCEAIGREDREFEEMDVAFAVPIVWKELPAKARLVR